MDGKKDIIYLTSGKTPYRSLFFKELSRYTKIKVLYELERSFDREWATENNENNQLKEVVMKSIKKNRDSAFCPNVLRHLKGKNYCVIVGGYSTPTAMWTIFWRRLFRKPYILNADGGFIKKDKWLTNKIKRFFIGGASHWLSTGKETTKYLIHYGAKKERIIEYPFASNVAQDILGEPMSLQEKIDIRIRLGIKEPKVILAVGQFIHRKGFDLLLKTEVLSDSNIGLYIIGGNPSEEYLQLQQKRQLHNVHFIGFKQKEELENYYYAADIFILPTREDIWGLVVNEAMAKGLPIVTTDKCIAGLELILNGYNGFIVPSEDISALSEAIKKIIYNDALKEEMAKNALLKISEYSIEKMVLAHWEGLSDIL